MQLSGTSGRKAQALVISALPGQLLLAGCGSLVDCETRLDRAQNAFANGNFRAAVIDANDVPQIDSRPGGFAAQVPVAGCYQNLQQLNDAIAADEKILAELPDNAIALNDPAWNYRVVGDDRAGNAGRRVYERMPDNGSIADTPGRMFVGQSADAEGVGLLRKAEKLSDGRAEIGYHLAVEFELPGQKEEARQKPTNILDRGQEFTSEDDARQVVADP